jgi:hypothetical protein
MEKDPDTREGSSDASDDETPPPFQPDPDIVSFLEQGRKDDPKAEFRKIQSDKR